MEENPDFEVVAINDLTDAKTLAYLLKYDTSHRNYRVGEISNTEDSIIVGDRKIRVYSEANPANLPWGELGVEEVFECTGFFTSREKASLHIEAGAKKVIISAPATGELDTVVFNVNHDVLSGDETIISAASCTTNCLAPVCKVLNDNFGIQAGYMTTIHAYTNNQTLLDAPNKKGIESRRGRAAAANAVPTSTGAAKAIGLVIPEINGKLKGGAIRIPVTTGSMIDLTVELNRNTSVEEINKVFRENANESLGYTEDPIVSSDVIGSTYGSLFDSLLTDIVEVDGKQMVKVFAWYDNEYSYSMQMVRTAHYLGRFLK